MWINASDGFLASTTSATDPLQANVWTEIVTSGLVPSNAARGQIQISIPVANVTGLAAGDTLDTTAWLLYEPVPGFDGTYFDGDSLGGSWDGAGHASRSRKITGVV